MLPILYSQPFRSSFCKIQNLDTEGFQLAGPLLQHSDLMRDSDVGKVGVDSFHDLIIILRHTLELEIKVIEPGDELHSRRVAFDDDELLGEDAVDDKTALVMLQSGLTKHLVEADMLLFIEPERILVTRRSELPAGLVCQFSVGIHTIG